MDELDLAHKEKGSAVIELNKIRIKLRKYAEREAANPSSILNEIKKGEKSTEELNEKCNQLEAKIAECDKILEGYNSMDKQC